MKPLVSIIIPCYNVEKYLNQCVESIINQSYSNLEIILVNDGSTDNTPHMCDCWALKDARIKVIHKNNGGVSSARNAGLDVCCGEWLAMPDSDDWYEPDAIQQLIELALKNKSEYVRCNHFCNTDNGKEWKHKNFYPTLLIRYGDEIKQQRYNMLFPYHDMMANGVYQDSIRGVNGPLYKKSVINGHKTKIRFNTNMKIAEDALFNLQVLDNIKAFTICNKFLYHYRISRTSVMNKYNPNIFDINESAMIGFYEYIKDELDNDFEMRKCFTGFAAECVFRSLKLNILNKENTLTLSKKIEIYQNMFTSPMYRYAFSIEHFDFLPKGKKEIIESAVKNNMFLSLLIGKICMLYLNFKQIIKMHNLF